VVTHHESLKQFNISNHLFLRFNWLNIILRGHSLEIIEKKEKTSTNLYAISKKPLITESKKRIQSCLQIDKKKNHAIIR
jgi:hypothetical protein